jgi:hypothetical protein
MPFVPDKVKLHYSSPPAKEKENINRKKYNQNTNREKVAYPETCTFVFAALASPVQTSSTSDTK